jgi:hypothetical protein
MEPADRLSDLQLDRVAALAAGLPESDGLRVFLDVYLVVTRAVLVETPASAYEHPTFLYDLGARATSSLLDAVEAGASGRPVSHAWRPLLEARGVARMAKIQFALAGMNAHINRDLPLGIVGVCAAGGSRPRRDTPEHRDYARVEERFASVMEQVKRRLLDELGGLGDEVLGRVDDVVALWSVGRARAAAWANAEALWAIRGDAALSERFAGTLDRSVGMTSRALLVRTL